MLPEEEQILFQVRLVPPNPPLDCWLHMHDRLLAQLSFVITQAALRRQDSHGLGPQRYLPHRGPALVSDMLQHSDPAFANAKPRPLC